MRIALIDYKAGNLTSVRKALAALRPKLHRYCARMTGSVIDGEDVVVWSDDVPTPTIARYGYDKEYKFANLMNEAGISGMRFSVSETAKWGDVSVGPKIIDKSVKKRMEKALKEIQTGKFAKDWVAEYKGGYKKYNALLAKDERHQIEKTGERLRGTTVNRSLRMLTISLLCCLKES